MLEQSKLKSNMDFFEIKPIKAAKVSEISEIVSSADVLKEAKVNFHIGNPVFHRDLVEKYCKNVFSKNSEISEDFQNLIKKTVENCVPYAKRGGFDRQNPDFLANYVFKWFSEIQEEKLYYDLGKESCKREIIFGSGGINENIRVLFHSLKNHLVINTVNVILNNFQISDYLRNSYKLNYENFENENFTNSLKLYLKKNKNVPNFLILGKIPNEETRRVLREFCLKYPLFIVEINNALNSQSLAREASLKNRVIRFLTFEAVESSLKNLSTVIIAGNYKYLSLFETIHFQLKGTPSYSEIIFTSYLLEKKDKFIPEKLAKNNLNLPTETDKFSNLNKLRKFEKIISKVENLINNKVNDNNFNLLKFQEKLNKITRKYFKSFDDFQNIRSENFLNLFFKKFHDKDFINQLDSSFKNAFCQIHKKYNFENLTLVSGSSRTALSLLGFHCGIEEVIMPDLGWTYSHCFKKVETVSLNSDLSLNVEKILKKVDEKLSENEKFKNFGAVTINSPHNASGKVFKLNKLEKLVKELVNRKVRIIDDLSYERIHPRNDLNGISTIKEIFIDLISKGQLKSNASKYLITVHSLSKTDCFAGARISFVEINERGLKDKFNKIIEKFPKNIWAMAVSYLFYLSGKENIEKFWLKRNEIFSERMGAILKAFEKFPKSRNQFNIKVIPPEGSMYPRLVIDKLPSGISLNWLSSGLAVRGIGLVPLSIFSHTLEGFDIARKTFRLTLGGDESYDSLLKKCRKLLIELNFLIAKESNSYNLNVLGNEKVEIKNKSEIDNLIENFEKSFRLNISKSYKKLFKFQKILNMDLDKLKDNYNEYISYRLGVFKDKIYDSYLLKKQILENAKNDKGVALIKSLKKEFYKDSLEKREVLFNKRLYDRTVHPTQNYSLEIDVLIDKFLEKFKINNKMDENLLKTICDLTFFEFLGENVPISSKSEGEEVICDLNALIESEIFGELFFGKKVKTFLSFWSDWDGSSRPSGQGHRLVAYVLIENIEKLSSLVSILDEVEQGEIDESILNEIRIFKKNKNEFITLLDEITNLTNRLEKQFQTNFNVDFKNGFFRKLGEKLHIVKDPVTTLFNHNNRLELKMNKLKEERKSQLEYCFSLNKKLRKLLYSKLYLIEKNINNEKLILSFGSYKDLLKRFVLTPRIHQKSILTADPFSLSTTVKNILEINNISGNYGNPGMILALQISMSTKADAFIKLDKKFNELLKSYQNDHQLTNIPFVKIIPLFEEQNAINNIKEYLDNLFAYFNSVKKMGQSLNERALESLCEFFIAGSDLSQQLSQKRGEILYKLGKYRILKYFANTGLAEKIRIKLGSGEPMQRQGGYYDEFAGTDTLNFNDKVKLKLRMEKYLTSCSQKSLTYAKRQLCGVFSNGEFRTLQSNVCEKLRHITVNKRSNLLYHMKLSMKHSNKFIEKAIQPMIETRLLSEDIGKGKLKQIILGNENKVSMEFSKINSKYFRQILYGDEKDLVGIHVISYFISRTTPTLRDRPVVRPGRDTGSKQSSKVVDKLKEMVPLSNYGSMLRAIGHNRAQSVVLGINQLTTGLFRAFSQFVSNFSNIEEGKVVLSEMILPNLPVKDILNTLRLYQDENLKYVSYFEQYFPAKNTVFNILKEENIAMEKFLPLIQKEFVRRMGLEPNDFFENNKFNQNLLPNFAPDIAVLLQKNLFNESVSNVLKDIEIKPDKLWEIRFNKLLNERVKITYFREKIWDLIKNSIELQVGNFIKLAYAIDEITFNSNGLGSNYNINSENNSKTNFSNYLKNEKDEKLKQFLSNAIFYLENEVPKLQNIPVEVLITLKDVKQILKIEEQAIDAKQQKLFKYYLLAISRIAKENG